jgi:hypothetical protein
MKDNNEINKYLLLDDLFNVFSEASYEKEDEEILEQSGINVEEIVAKNMMLFRQLKTQAKAELNRAKHNRVLDFLTKVKEGIDSKQEKYLRIADEIMAKPNFEALQPMFRNLHEVSPQDKQSILMDAKLLDLLSDIEEEYNNDK